MGPGAGRRSAGGSAEVWNRVAAGAVRRLKGEFTATAAAAAAAASGFGRIRGANGFEGSFENTNFTCKGGKKKKKMRRTKVWSPPLASKIVGGFKNIAVNI